MGANASGLAHRGQRIGAGVSRLGHGHECRCMRAGHIPLPLDYHDHHDHHDHHYNKHTRGDDHDVLLAMTAAAAAGGGGDTQITMTINEDDRDLQTNAFTQNETITFNCLINNIKISIKERINSKNKVKTNRQT